MSAQPPSHFLPISPWTPPTEESFGTSYEGTPKSLAPHNSSKVSQYLSEIAQRVHKRPLGRKTSTSNSEPNPPHRTLSGRSRIPLASASETGRDQLLLEHKDAYAYPPPAPSARMVARMRQTPAEPQDVRQAMLAELEGNAPRRPALHHAKSSDALTSRSIGRGVARPLVPSGALAQRRQNPPPQPSHSPQIAPRSRAPSDAAPPALERLAISELPPPMPGYVRQLPARNIALPTSQLDVFNRYDKLFNETFAISRQIDACDYELTRLGRKAVRLRDEQQQLARNRAQWARLQAGRSRPDVPETVGDSRAGSPPPSTEQSLSTEQSVYSPPSERPQVFGGGFGPLSLRNLPAAVAQSAPVTPAQNSPELTVMRDYPWGPSGSGPASSTQSLRPPVSSSSLAGPQPIFATSQSERNVLALLQNLEQQIGALIEEKTQLQLDLRDKELDRNLLREWARSTARRGETSNN